MSLEKKNFIWNIIGSTINAGTSLLFLIIVTRINGTDLAGIFTFCYSTACLFQVFGTYAGRSYQVTERNKEINDFDFINNRFFTCFLMILLAFVFSFVKGYNAYKIIVLILLVIFKSIEAFSETIYGIIQKNGHLYKVGFSLFLKAIIGVIVFFIIDYYTSNIYFSSSMLVIANLIILLFYDLKNIKLDSNKFNFKGIMEILKCGFWTFAFTFLIQYVINAPKYAIDSFMANEFQTVFGIIMMPATLMILCSQFLIQPFLNKLTNDLNESNYIGFKKTTYKISLSLFIIGISIIICAYFFGIPFLELLYGISLKSFKLELIIIIFGAVMFGISYIISNSLIALRKTFIQTIIYFVAGMVIYILSNYLVRKFGILGASLSYMITNVLVLLFYLLLFNYILKIKSK